MDFIKLIYVYERRHAYNYDYEMFGFEYFENKGFELEIWSLVDWTFEDVAFPVNGARGDNIYYISNPEELVNNLERVNNGKCYFLIYPYHAYSFKSYILRRYIKNHGFFFSNLTESPTIVNLNNKESIARDLYIVTSRLAKMLAFLLIGLFDKRKKWKEKYSEYAVGLFGCMLAKSDYNFVTTELQYYSYPNPLERFSNRNVLLHSESYEEYLNLCKNGNGSKTEHSIVFIDQFITGHSDLKKNKMKPMIQDVKGYYASLCALFDKLEEKYKCKVIIAAHPKAEYAGHEFGMREIVFGNTSRLVMNSKLVIVQYSTSFGLICLFEKDFIQIYNDEMFQNYPDLEKTYNMISRIFGSKALNFGDEKSINSIDSYIVKYSPDLYNKYKEALLISKKSIAVDKSMYEIMADKIMDSILYNKQG